MLVQAIIKRILIGVVTLLVVSFIIFIGTSLLPGDVANIILGQMATPESLAHLREHLGLDKPPHVRYLMWLGNLMSGDLGTVSYTHLRAHETPEHLGCRDLL